MNKKEKNSFLKTAKQLFKDTLIKNHKKNTRKLSTMDKFNLNPFLHKYITKIGFGDYTPENRARALLIIRSLGSSITTTFGVFAQKLCTELKKVHGSGIEGMDIEFIDQDGKTIYCQLKSGVQTINKDDVKTIKDNFSTLIRRAKINGETINNNQCVVGVVYGTKDRLSPNYKSIDKVYPVVVGKDFWKLLTNDDDFYKELIEACEEVVDDIESDNYVEATIKKLTADIKNHENI